MSGPNSPKPYPEPYFEKRGRVSPRPLWRHLDAKGPPTNWFGCGRKPTSSGNDAEAKRGPLKGVLPSTASVRPRPSRALCYEIVLPGQKSGFRAAWGPDSNPVGRRPAGGPILKVSRMESDRSPARKSDLRPGITSAQHNVPPASPGEARGTQIRSKT